MTSFEIAANLITALSIFLAARNSLHTWWTGIFGCLLFINVFYQAKLYADATLQMFFIGSSLWGWWYWFNHQQTEARPIQKTQWPSLLWMSLAALLTTAFYGSMLYFWTDAYAPFIDSAVLAFSVMAQLLLMQRRLETWWIWLIVNTLSVPLFASRGLYLTAGLYAAYWLNAWYGLWRWRKQWQSQQQQISSIII
jgi:nicotinamide mononucleotide transporter